MHNYLYRTLDNDEDGDPHDFGVISAQSEADALRQLGHYFYNALDFELDCEVYLYLLANRDRDGAGVWASGARTRHTVRMP